MLLRRLRWLLLSTVVGRTRSCGRRWAAVRLSRQQELSGRAVHEELDGLDIERQHGRRLFVCATLTGRRRDHTPSVRAGADASNTGAEAFSQTQQFQEVECRFRGDVGLSSHSAFHRWSVQSNTLLLLLSDDLMCCCAAGTKECLGMRGGEFALGY